MKAAIYRQTGGPDMLRYEDVPDPVPAAGDILIRVEAISVEGGDLFGRATIDPGEPPRILGYAAAGSVIGLGAGVETFSIGDRVTTFAFDGSHAELRAVSATTSWRIPDGLDMKVAAAIPCGLGTAAFALKLGGLEAGETVLILGAAGGVGQAVVQLAHRAGARVIGTGTDAGTLEDLRAHGLSDAIVIGERSVDDQVRELLSGRGADLLVDCVGGRAMKDGLMAIEDGGRAVLIGVLGGVDGMIDAAHLLFHRKTVSGCLFGAVIGEAANRRIVEDLLDQAAAGDVSVPIGMVFPLSDAAAAHAQAERRGRRGRVFIIPSFETSVRS